MKYTASHPESYTHIINQSVLKWLEPNRNDGGRPTETSCVVNGTSQHHRFGWSKLSGLQDFSGAQGLSGIALDAR